MSWNEENLAPPPPPPPPPPPVAQEPPPAKKGCGKWVACGCLGILAAIVVFGGGLAWFVFHAMRSSEVYATALARAQSDPRVIAAVGEPLTPTWFPSGSISVENDRGNADTTIPFKGPKGKGSIHVVATKAHNDWTYTTMVVTTDSGQTIDLLTPAESTDTAPPSV